MAHIAPDPSAQPALSVAERLDPSRTALIVVDAQNDFCHPDGACARQLGADLSQVARAIPRLGLLLEGAREAGVLAVFIKSIYDDRYLSPVLRDQYVRRGLRDICQTGEWGSEFYGDISPDVGRGEPVIVKHRYNAFHSTELDVTLHDRSINGLVVAGFLTSVCVESTARDAFFRGYYTSIASDAAAEFDPELHDSTLRLFDRSFGPVLSVDEILGLWARNPVSP